MAKKLFRPAKADWHRNAIIGGPLTDYLDYALGYQEAADVLVDVALETHRMDLLFFPICFCYRHFAELTLKKLLIDFHSYIKLLREIGEPVAVNELSLVSGLDETHSLEALAQRLRGAIEGTTDEEFDPEVWSTLIELHNIDTDAQKFRYPVDAKKQPAFPNQAHYDLGNIKTRMHSVVAFLVGSVSWLDDQIRIANDMLTELAQNESWADT